MSIAPARPGVGDETGQSLPEGENYQKVQFEGEQLHVTRLVCATGKTLDIPAGDSSPALLIALFPARLGVIGPIGKTSKRNLSLGQTDWQPAGKQARLESSGCAPSELLRFELKTGPAGALGGNPRAHDHSNE